MGASDWHTPEEDEYDERRIPEEDQRDDERRPWHEEPDHERDLQVDNLDKKSGGLIIKTLGYLGGTSLGKVLGPLDSLAGGIPVAAEGIPAVLDAHQTRDQRIHDQSGGAFPEPEPWRAGRGDTPPPPQADPPPEQRREPTKGDRRAQEVLDNIRIKLEIEETSRRQSRAWLE